MISPMKKNLFLLLTFWGVAAVAAAQTATTFEMRYFTRDAKADGVTDFHGETEWFTTEQRVEMLGKYARYASRFWGDPGLDTPLLEEADVNEAALCDSEAVQHHKITLHREGFDFFKGRLCIRYSPWFPEDGAVVAEEEFPVDLEGNPLEASPWLLHPMMTRGIQDSYSGYDNPWSDIRNMPSPWARWTLAAKDLCYFNFEHEESIGMPNWSLARKEPWYKINSYEKNYEEGNIGTSLDFDQWRESQAYQAFGAWESMKMQLLMGTSGFSWCSLESGPNMFTYQKPLVDAFCVPKLAFHANRMAFQRLWAASDDVDTVYGPGDSITPVIFNLDGACTVRLEVQLQDEKGKVLEGRSVTRLAPFRFRSRRSGCHFIVYQVQYE